MNTCLTGRFPQSSKTSDIGAQSHHQPAAWRRHLFSLYLGVHLISFCFRTETTILTAAGNQERRWWMALLNADYNLNQKLEGWSQMGNCSWLVLFEDKSSVVSRKSYILAFCDPFLQRSFRRSLKTT
ncbi:hypothetical protein L1987_40177 [Smallanthus sonchifolius]|uniref:Uncharacterized protein n=1 Tax=Smallanthus sonchifolius TaxID=185202 RepID=A0ACB9GSQ9_9ASTR|nr:hypothetical protein L1987_40177 [Smallanthus sonchifolius]